MFNNLLWLYLKTLFSIDWFMQINIVSFNVKYLSKIEKMIFLAFFLFKFESWLLTNFDYFDYVPERSILHCAFPIFVHFSLHKYYYVALVLQLLFFCCSYPFTIFKKYLSKKFFVMHYHVSLYVSFTKLMLLM